MILLIDNYDSFTWNLVHRFGELDPTLRPDHGLVVVRNDRVTPDDVERIDAGRPPGAIVISPGPCTPAEAGVSGALVERFAGRTPILGVCLGHQCIAAVNGMTVARHETPMHGKTSPIHHDGRGFFRGLPNPFTATRYHSLVVLADSVPPPPPPGRDGWEISAWTTDTLPDGRTVRAVMGLRRVPAAPGAAPAEGVQFHPESFLTSDGPRLLANFLRAAGRSPARDTVPA